MDVSNVTEKSLADYSASEKASWREYEDDPDKFIDSLDWLSHEKEAFRMLYQGSETQLKDFLIDTAQADLSRVKTFLEGPENAETIQWTSLPLIPGRRSPTHYVMLSFSVGSKSRK